MKNVSQAAFRILDANLHRATEGLRVLMDLSRFACDDKDCSEKLKSVRHDVFKVFQDLPDFYSKAAQARDATGDVGRFIQNGAMAPRENLEDLYRANLHRSQESLRTLEETLKLLSPEASRQIENLRFRLYAIDKDLLAKIQQTNARSRMHFDLYVVTDRKLSGGKDFLQVAEKAIRGGAGAIQLREKEWSKRELLPVAMDLRALTRENNVTFIINDHLDVALVCGADGCHLGQEDFPVKEARKIVGPGFILGASTHSLEEALEAEADGATYVNVGPVFPTKTKETGCQPVGTSLITQVKKALNIPQTCMGGINCDNVSQVVEAGANRIAVVSAVVAADDVEGAARALFELIQTAKKTRGDN